MKVQFKDTPKGEVAILPRAEYERLRQIADEAAEDMGTARLVANARRDVANGAPLLPLAVVERLANGENPVRVLREFQNLTQQKLAESVQITQNYLSEIETGKRKGPFELHWKIAISLGVTVDLLGTTAASTGKSKPEQRVARKRAIAGVHPNRRK